MAGRLPREQGRDLDQGLRDQDRNGIENLASRFEGPEISASPRLWSAPELVCGSCAETPSRTLPLLTPNSTSGQTPLAGTILAPKRSKRPRPGSPLGAPAFPPPAGCPPFGPRGARRRSGPEGMPPMRHVPRPPEPLLVLGRTGSSPAGSTAGRRWPPSAGP